jgi:hypothetical protein
MHAPRHKTQAKAIAVARRSRWNLFMAVSGLGFILLCIAKTYSPSLL